MDYVTSQGAMRIKGVATLLLALGLASGCATGPTGAARDEAGREDLLAAFDGVAVADILRAGDAAAAAGEHDRALFIYTQALELDPTADTWVRMGYVYQRLGQKSQAWQAYANALRIAPDHAAAHEEIGLLYLGMGQRDAAATHLGRAVALEPARWRAHNALGIMADVKRDYGKAIGHYEAALAANPESAMLLNNLGYSHYLAGNLNQAETHFRMAVGVDPAYAPAIANLGLAHARRRDYDEAVEILRQAMSKAQAYNDVGFIAFHNGDLDEAAWLLTEAIRISPAHYETARQNLRRVREAMLERDAPAAVAGERAAIPAAVAAAGEARLVRAERLNVRGAAATDAPVVGTLARDEQVDVMHEQGGWSFIAYWRTDDAGRQTGWVNSRYLETAAGRDARAAAARVPPPAAPVTDPTPPASGRALTEDATDPSGTGGPTPGNVAALSEEVTPDGAIDLASDERPGDGEAILPADPLAGAPADGGSRPAPAGEPEPAPSTSRAEPRMPAAAAPPEQAAATEPQG